MKTEKRKLSKLNKLNIVLAAAAAVLAIVLIAGIRKPDGTAVRLSRFRMNGTVFVNETHRETFLLNGTHERTVLKSGEKFTGDYNYLFSRKLSRSESEELGYDREDYYEVYDQEGWSFPQKSWVIRYKGSEPVSASCNGTEFFPE